MESNLQITNLSENAVSKKDLDTVAKNLKRIEYLKNQMEKDELKLSQKIQYFDKMVEYVQKKYQAKNTRLGKLITLLEQQNNTILFPE